MTLNSTPILGDPLIDQQHSELFDSLRVIQALHDRRVNDEKVTDSLTQISNQLYQHFMAEEALMKRVNMPVHELDAHSQEHMRILEELADLHFSIMQGRINRVSDVLKRVTNWVVEHVQVFDAPISRYIAKANPH